MKRHTESRYPNPIVVILLFAGALVFPLALYGMSLGIDATGPYMDRLIRAVFGEMGDDASGIFGMTCFVFVWFGVITGVPTLVQIAFDERTASKSADRTAS